MAIKGAKPGDLLEIEFQEIKPEPFAFTCIVPGLGFLSDVFTTPFIVKWKIENNVATSEQLPGVRIPGASFMGVSGVAPSKDKVNLNLATRNAVLQMIDILQERGYSKEQAYCICSVAVDLRISNVVDVPNFVVSAILPEGIFVK